MSAKTNHPINTISMLTTHQRLSAYQYVRSQITSDFDFVCGFLRQWLGDNIDPDYYAYTFKQMMYLFPEFEAQRPPATKLDWPWWYGTEKRIQAIDNAIEILKQSI